MQGSESSGDRDEGGEQQVATDRRPVWETPKLMYEGNVEELVLAIPGKASVHPGDAQENRKVPGL